MNSNNAKTEKKEELVMDEQVQIIKSVGNTIKKRASQFNTAMSNKYSLNVNEENKAVIDDNEKIINPG